MTLFTIINLIALILLNIIGCMIAYWIYTSSTSKKNKTNILFLVVIVCMVMWTNFNYFGDIVDNTFLSFLFKKLYFSLVSIFFVFIYLFSVFFPEISGKRNIHFEKFTILIWTLFSFLILFTNVIIKDIKKESWGVNLVGGELMPLFYLFVTYYVFLVLYKLIKKYFQLSHINKKKVLYFLIGISMYAIFQLIFNVFIPTLFKTKQYWQFGDYSAIFFLSLTAYAIVKHELMGIKTLLTQVLIAIISIILLLDVLFLSDNITMQLLKIGILLAFLYFSRELIKSVRKEMKARKELENTYKKINQYIKQLEKINESLKERNNDLKAILEASGKVTENLDSQKIAQDVVDSIPGSLGHLGDKGGILILYDKNKKIIYTYAITESAIVKKAKKLLDKPFKDYTQPINEADNFTIKTIKTKKIYTGDRLEDFIAPTVNKNICGLIQKLTRSRSFVSIPLLSRGNIIGVIVFVGTKPVKEIAQRDKDVLYMFSSHIGSAIENAQLYEQTNKQMSELSDLNNKLEKANQSLKELMDVKNEFLHITSHQLRTPLTAIRGMISMWNSGDFDNMPDEEKKKMIERIYLSVERLNNITNDMLDALELEGGFFKFQFRAVFLEEAIKEAIDILKPNYDKKGLYVKFDFDKNNVSEIEAEPNYIRQVFLNLIDNACKYTKGGGVEINISKSKDYIAVIIKDTGIGIGKRDQKKMFEKFSRGKNAVLMNATGSGLGLFIAKKIVDGHHGKIEFYSEGIGRGSVVKVFLPVKQ